MDPNHKKRVGKDALVNKSTDNAINFFMGEIFLQAEDEASIINQYINSQKEKRDDKKKLNGVQQSQGGKGGGLKSMKELIAETLKENEDRKEQLKKLLDWTSLNVVIDKQKRMEEEKKYVNIFKTHHFNKKKPKIDPLK